MVKGLDVDEGDPTRELGEVPVDVDVVLGQVQDDEGVDHAILEKEVPKSVERIPCCPAAEPQSKRDPEVTRNRLNAFQQGRHRYTNGHPALPKQQPEDEAKTEWLLHTDERVEQVESALNKDPAEYTPAGLPQRTPRAQLAPGNATESGENESTAGPRNAHLVRGRLTSFQQGVREGKHYPRTR